MSTVTDVLAEVKAGRMSTEDASAAFTDMDWPGARQPARSLADVESDPDPRVMQPGDAGEIEAAYVDGDITLEQYQRFATAAIGTEGVNTTATER